MVHVELRHADDAAELRHEAAQHAGLVHAPQRHLRIGVRRQQLDEDAVGLRVIAQLVVDQALGLAQQPDGVGMQERVGKVRLGEKADEVHRIALEHILVGDVQPVVVDAEVGALAQLPALLPVQRAQEPAESGRCLELLHLQRRAQDRRQIADVLGDEKVVLHEAFDGDQAAAVVVTELRGEPRLHIERQHLLRAAAEEVQKAADRP